MSINTNQNKILYGISRFKNIGGVTCYMNSILHILQQIPIFADYIFHQKFDKIISKKYEGNKKEETIAHQIYKLFNLSMTEDDLVIRPLSFKKCVGDKDDIWNELRHQDSQEFLSFLISKLEEEVGEVVQFIPGGNIIINKELNSSVISAEMAWIKFQAREYSPLKNMFEGMTVKQTKCMCCFNLSDVYEPFTTLQVEIPITENNSKKDFSLDECLEFMTKEEQLDNKNLYNCEMCGLKNKAFRNILLWRTPKILIIHIKRFGVKSNKLTNQINYPIYDLDIEKYFHNKSPYKNNSKYDLIGINLHQGFANQSINVGHYTSLVKNRYDNNWYLFDDGNTPLKATKEEHLQQSNAYLLFYYRKD